MSPGTFTCGAPKAVLAIKGLYALLNSLFWEHLGAIFSSDSDATTVVVIIESRSNQPSKGGHRPMIGLAPSTYCFSFLFG
jgi:hypothetical protein